jgi:hypothetical protein
MTWLERLLPARLRPAAVEDLELEQLWRRVPDDDPCLRAVNELLARHLEESVAMAGSLQSSAELKLRACERMECFRLLLLELEALRAEARKKPQT